MNGYDFLGNDSLLVMDLRQRLLKIFTLEGNVLKSSTILKEGEYSATGGLEFHIYNNKIYVPIFQNEFVNQQDSSKLIAEFNLQGEIQHVFGTFDSFLLDDNQYTLTTRFHITPEGKLYSNLRTSPYIFSYNITGYKFENKFGIKYPSFSIPDEEVSAQLSIPEINKRSIGKNLVNHISSTDEFFIQHVQVLTKEWFENVNYEDKDNFLVLYDVETKEFLGEIYTEHTLGAVHNNQLYMIEDFNPDNYTIGIYELVEKKKL